jgi:uncharacterized membrane protein YtjA (UPF0391 family)
MKNRDGDRNILTWAIVFPVVALIVAVLGFGGIAATAVGIAKIPFIVFVTLFEISLIAHLVRGRALPPV